MKVKELIEKLKEIDENKEVFVEVVKIDCFEGIEGYENSVIDEIRVEDNNVTIVPKTEY